MKSFKEAFEDPFIAASNAERREKGLPDYEGEPESVYANRGAPWYVIYYSHDGTYWLPAAYDQTRFWTSDKREAMLFSTEQEAQMQINDLVSRGADYRYFSVQPNYFTDW
jgi:hypothetical protein